MTAGDNPLTTGQPSQGGEGVRFVGVTGIEMPAPNANRRYDIASIFLSGPKRCKEIVRDWTKMTKRPRGTGPWMITKVLPRERVEFVYASNNREAPRVPKCERLVIIMPDAGGWRHSVKAF